MEQLTQTISNLVGILLGVVGAIGVGFFIYGAYLYLTASGAPHQMERGKSAMMTALAGIVLALVAYGVVELVMNAVVDPGIDTAAAALVHELMEARDERRLLNLQRQLSRLGLLIVDELGFVPLSPTVAELLFEVFSQRYERGSILVTTTTSPSMSGPRSSARNASPELCWTVSPTTSRSRDRSHYEHTLHRAITVF